MLDVVVIGGGHGSATMLRGLKNLNNINLTSIVAVSDDGGSTGRLRELYNIPAIGDIRNVMTAMAEEETMFQFLMDYRFTGENNVDVIGHNLGNLIMKALIDRSGGNLTEAISTISKVLNVKGDIYPSSLESITLFARMKDDTIVKGEANIPSVHNSISKVFFDHRVKASYQALQAIRKADLIILGIGSLFTSILPNLIIEEIANAVNNNPCPTIYYCNIMSEPGETDGYTMEEHVNILEKHGVSVDAVVCASDTIPEKLLKKYEEHGQSVIEVTQSDHSYKVIYEKLLSFEEDVVRHSPFKIKETFQDVLDKVL